MMKVHCVRVKISEAREIAVVTNQQIMFLEDSFF